ncbi:MAG: transposase [Sedimenticola sp.]
MPDYRRNRVPGGCFFFTVNLLDRKRSLLLSHIGELKAAIRKTHQKRPFHIDGWVVLPDHMHCVWTLPTGDDDYSSRWQSIKKAFSKSIPKGEHLSPVRLRRKERGVWQRRFWEHTIRNGSDYARHMDYLHYNPVKHGLAERVSDWPHSTYHRLVREGVYSAEWGDDVMLHDVGERA